MVTLEQIQLLEKRVRAAVSRIASLKHENELLKEKLQKYETRFTELEQKISQYKQDQSEIEQGIISALEQLDHIEDEVVDSPGSEAQAAQERQAPRRDETGSTQQTAQQSGFAPASTDLGEPREDQAHAPTAENPGAAENPRTEYYDEPGPSQEPARVEQAPAAEQPVSEQQPAADHSNEVTVEDADEEEEDQTKQPSDELDIF